MTAGLDRYFERIGYGGPVEPTVDVLRGIHRAHLLAIPYENFDIHLGRPLRLDPERFYAKLVDARRGGWCYEMNGLLAWALRAIGFRVTMVSGTVGRAQRGDSVEGNHLVLLVDLDRPWVADTGFGDGFLDPVPLAEGEFSQLGLTYRLERSGARWQFHNQPWGGAAGFDFTAEPRALADFEARCHDLQTSPESSFVRATVCERFTPEAIVSLRGAVLRTITADGPVDVVLTGRQAFERTLEDTFGLDSGPIGALWPQIEARHEAWVARTAAEAAAVGASRLPETPSPKRSR